MNKTTTTLIAVFFMTTAFARQNNFSGTWVLKDQISISGTLYSNGVPRQMNAIQTNESMTVYRIMVTPQGEDVTATETFKFDGKPVETTTASKEKKITIVQWAKDGKGFTQTTHYYPATDPTKLEFSNTDVWSMEDGKLIFIRKAENFENGEIWESRSVYEKKQ